MSQLACCATAGMLMSLSHLPDASQCPIPRRMTLGRCPQSHGGLSVQPQSAEGASKEGAKGTAVLTRVRTAAAVALRSESAALEPEPELRPPKNTRVKYVGACTKRL